MKILTKDTSNVSYNQLLQFVLKLDEDFVPPLSTRVNLRNYVAKLLKEAQIFICIIDDQIVGVLAFYNNDTLNKLGYISYLAVDKSCRGRGIAVKLLDECILHCQKAGIRVINVETWESNVPVTLLYKSKGFIVKDIVDDRIGEKSLKLTLTL